MCLRIQGGIKSLEFQALPLPKFTLKPNQVFLEYPKSRETETVVFNIEFQQNQFHIEGIDSSQEWINSVDLSKAPETVRLEINCNQLEKNIIQKRYALSCADPPNPLKRRFKFKRKY